MVLNAADSSGLPSLGRADSGGSTSSSSSSSSSLLSSSACSSLFSAQDADGQRRDSFASSVFEESDSDDKDTNKDSITPSDVTGSDSSSTTPTPELPSPTRLSLTRSSSNHSTTSTASVTSDDDDGSSSSHDSYISTTNMATPTAELYALSLHPITSPSAPVGDSSTSSRDQGIVATSHEEQGQGRGGPHYSPRQSNRTNNSIIASSSPAHAATTSGTSSTITSNNSGSSSKFIHATSPDMLKFAARVASRGVPFSPKRTSIPSASGTITTTRPSTSKGLMHGKKTLNAEGFPWTARPSSYSPRATSSSSSHTYTSTSASRPSTSGSISGGNTTYSSSLGGTPSAIFSNYDEDAEDISASSEEEEVEVLSELFPSNFSGKTKNKSASRPATRDGGAIPASSSSLYASRPSSSASLSKAGLNSTALTGQTRTTTDRTDNIDDALRHLQNVNGNGTASIHRSTATPEARAHTLSTNANPSMDIDRSSPRMNSRTVTAARSEGDSQRYAGAPLAEVRNGKLSSLVDSLDGDHATTAGHSLTPPIRSTSGAPESTTVAATTGAGSSMSSSKSSMWAGTEYPPPASAFFESAPASSNNTTATDDVSSSDLRSTSTGQRSSVDGPRRERSESLFRYEAPSTTTSSSIVGSTLALPPQKQQNMTTSQATVDTMRSSPHLLSVSTSEGAASQQAKSITSLPYTTAALLGVSVAHLPNPASPTLSSSSERDAQVHPYNLESQSRKASLDYGHHGSSSLYGAHLNSLNYHAGSTGSNSTTSRPSSTSSSSAAYPSNSSQMNRNWTRPWVRDSDSSSIKSSSGLSSDGSRSSFENSERELNVMSPAAPPHVPFLSTAPAPPGCKIIVHTLQPDGFDIFITLPGFSHENITLALKKSGALHILADKYEEDSHGHFERMVGLGESARDSKVTAIFNGDTLEVHVRKNPKEEKTSRMSSRGTGSTYAHSATSSFGAGSTSSNTSSSSYRSGNNDAGPGGSYSPPVYFGGTDPVAFYSSSPVLSGASYIAR